MVKNKIIRALSRSGYQLKRTGPVEAPRAVDPVRALLRTQLPRPVVIGVPVERVRGLYWFPLEDKKHPFVAAVAACRAGGSRSYKASPLASYYASCTPADALEAVGLSAEDAPGFAGAPALAFSLPWLGGSPEKWVRYRTEVARSEALEVGHDADEGEETKLFGPVSPAKGELETERLLRVLDSVVEAGYQRSAGPDGDIGGTVLLDEDGQWCVQVGRGQHRAAVLAALGWTALPFRIARPPTRVADLRYWPQVAAGRITPEGARAVFSRVMRGRPPETYDVFLHDA